MYQKRVLERHGINGSRYSKLSEVKFVEDSLQKIWSASTNFTWSILENLDPNETTVKKYVVKGDTHMREVGVGVGGGVAVRQK